MKISRVGPDEIFHRYLTSKWAFLPISGAGAATDGGRFNRPGVEALYLSRTANRTRGIQTGRQHHPAGDAWPLAALALLMLAVPANAQEGNNEVQSCQGIADIRDAPRTIEGCTKLLESGQLSNLQTALTLGTRALAYVAANNLDGSIADTTLAIRLLKADTTDPTKSVEFLGVAFNIRGLAYLSKEEFDRAIADMNEAIRIIRPKPKLAVAYYSRAKAYFAKGDFDRVITDATEAIRLDPLNAEPYGYRARAYYDKANSITRSLIRLKLFDSIPRMRWPTMRGQRPISKRTNPIRPSPI